MAGHTGHSRKKHGPLKSLLEILDTLPELSVVLRPVALSLTNAILDLALRRERANRRGARIRAAWLSELFVYTLHSPLLKAQWERQKPHSGVRTMRSELRKYLRSTIRSYSRGVRSSNKPSRRNAAGLRRFPLRRRKLTKCSGAISGYRRPQEPKICGAVGLDLEEISVLRKRLGP